MLVWFQLCLLLVGYDPGKSPHLSEPQRSHLYNGDLMGLASTRNSARHVVCLLKEQDSAGLGVVCKANTMGAAPTRGQH